MMQFLMFLISGMIMIWMIKELELKKLFTQSLMFLMSLMLVIMGSDSSLPMKISMNFMHDSYSYSLVSLVGWILGLMVLSLGMNEYKIGSLMNLILLLMLNMCILFFSVNVFIFYIFFEMSLIPMILIIVKWGYSSDRFKSMMYMYMYTMMFSLPLMIYMMYMYMNFKLMSMILMVYVNLKVESNLFMMMLLLFPFLVKIPMYFMHSWLPKAHVDAPLIGSMFLAGILLKLGGYGIMRILNMFGDCLSILLESLIVVSMVGSLVVSLQCLIQIDMKILVAYSSVVHMGMVLSGILTMSKYGYVGGMYMMISHGLCSSAMFYLVNFSYKLSGSRSMMMNKGLINYDAPMSMFWFLICTCNMAVPVSLNMMGEVFLVISILNFSVNLALVTAFAMFYSSCYTLYLYINTQHGHMNFGLMNKMMGKMVDYLNLLIHWIPLMLLFSGLSVMF